MKSLYCNYFIFFWIHCKIRLLFALAQNKWCKVKLFLRCWLIYLRFFFELTWVSTAGIDEFCAFCDILFTKYKANIENRKLKLNKKAKKNHFRNWIYIEHDRFLHLTINYQVVAQTRWIVPHANIVPTKQKHISGNSFVWNPSPRTIVSKLEIA